MRFLAVLALSYVTAVLALSLVSYALAGVL